MPKTSKFYTSVRFGNLTGIDQIFAGFGPLDARTAVGLQHNRIQASIFYDLPSKMQAQAVISMEKSSAVLMYVDMKKIQ